MKPFVALFLTSAAVAAQAAPTSPKEPQPVRQAWVSGKIYKSFFENGKYDLNPPLLVCEFRAQVPVYEAKEPAGQLGHVVDCSSVVDGKPVKASLMGEISINDSRAGKPADKSATVLLLVQGDKGVYSGQSGTVKSKDLGIRSLTTWVTSPSFNLKGRVEFFQIHAKFED